jgi:hypothetical protein
MVVVMAVAMDLVVGAILAMEVVQVGDIQDRAGLLGVVLLLAGAEVPAALAGFPGAAGHRGVAPIGSVCQGAGCFRSAGKGCF